MDIDYLLWLQGLRDLTGGALNGLFLVITELGEAILPLVLACGLYWCLDKQAGIRMLFACNISDFFNGVAKLSCCINRPWIRDSRVQPVAGALPGATGYSFPSGHSGKAVAAYGSLAVQYRRKKGFVWAMAALVVLILFSRNYLGVHTPQDVVVAALMSAAVIALVRFLLHKTDCAGEGSGLDLKIAGIGLLLGVAALIYVTQKSYPMTLDANGQLLVDPIKMQEDTFSAAGAMMGMLIGWIIERRWVRFQVEGSTLRRILRFVVGVGVLVLFYTVVRHGIIAVVGRNWGCFAGILLVMVLAVGVYPLMFTRFEQWLAGRQKSGAEA